jgi:hypothetical protein
MLNGKYKEMNESYYRFRMTTKMHEAFIAIRDRKNMSKELRKLLSDYLSNELTDQEKKNLNW